MKFDTWLQDSDIDRLYQVCMGTLDEVFASESELAEFMRLVNHAAMEKFAGEDYSQHTVH